jgi:hypothetical protein
LRRSSLIAVVPELIEFESLAGRDSFGADI